ncbi:hypothetical protein [Streptomyces sp. MST-110588]|uniref:hypothetical protein n=1 Tax=Streptomyces sp. MST-110588 TaxID=2833628 RepID=UPI001F5DF6A3|nr:hypothetical protein [Streptomyces sp. MST-110588]UNO42412.1 hypothetical protein KGS77_26435 [Streptomyces sp. MST-110588]
MKKRVGSAAVLAAAILSIGAAAPAMASSSVAAGGSNLKCRTSFGNTGGWVECTGSGTWRAVADCQFEPDDTSNWITQSGGTKRQSVECTFSIRGVSYEVR